MRVKNFLRNYVEPDKLGGVARQTLAERPFRSVRFHVMRDNDFNSRTTGETCNKHLHPAVNYFVSIPIYYFIASLYISANLRTS